MVMDQTKKQVHGQIEYMGRWVDKAHFRVFVYNETEQKITDSYEEYEKMISSGLWFDTKASAIASLKPKTAKINSKKEKLFNPELGE